MAVRASLVSHPHCGARATHGVSRFKEFAFVQGLDQLSEEKRSLSARTTVHDSARHMFGLEANNEV